MTKNKLRLRMQTTKENVEKHIGHKVQAYGNEKEGVLIRYVQKERLNIAGRIQGFSDEFWVKYEDQAFPQPEWMLKDCLTCGDKDSGC